MVQLEPGVWTCAIPLRSGTWRYRYYVQDNGLLTYAGPVTGLGQLDQLDGVFYIPGKHPEYEYAESSTHYPPQERTRAASPSSQYVGDQYPAAARHRESNHQHGRKLAADDEQGASYIGTQAETLWRRCFEVNAGR
jgi:hypothetical protein